MTWQISHTADILNRITGYGTHYLVRPPYGDYNSRVLSLSLLAQATNRQEIIARTRSIAKSFFIFLTSIYFGSRP